MSRKIASLHAEISADTSKFEQGAKKTKSALDQQAAAFAKFSADATRNAKSYLSYEAQKAKAIAATERAAAKLAREEERAAKAAAKAAEQRRKDSLVMAPGIERGTKSLQEFTQANAGLLSVATVAATAVIGIGVALDKTTKQVVEYGDQVQKLKTITGQSAEDTSRQIQLADDMRVSYDTLARSLQFASKKGIDTSINGLARLSEEYKALAPGIERTQFLTDNFGKSGVEMGKILEMDAEAIRNFSASAGQILTEEDLRNIKAYNHALDGLKDRFEATGNSIGKSFLPIKTGIIDSMSFYMETFRLMSEENIGFTDAAKKARDSINDEKAAFMAAGESADGLGEELDDLATQQADAEATARSLTQTYTSLLSSMFSIQKQNDSYKKTVEDIAKKDEELTHKKDALTLKMWEEQRAGKLTNDENLRYVQQIAEITAAQEENAELKAKAEEDNKKASDQRVYDLAQQKLAADGVVTSGEYEYLQNLAVSYGLVSRAAADNAIAEEKRANELAMSFEQTLPPMQRTLSLMQNIAAYNGTSVNFGVNFTTSGSTPNMSGVSNRGSSSTSAQAAAFYAQYSNMGPGRIPAGSRDSGGAGIAGEPYMIGTGAQPELFVPDTNGTFIPNADKKMGATYNIVVNNPKRETAENSIRSSLKKLSYIGVAA